jgi:hypothetical protein
MIWDIERAREQRDRENEAARGLYLPLPMPPERKPDEREDNNGRYA